MQSLGERIARDGPVGELDAIGWAIRLAKRLEALHELGVPHGSVSPACVLVEDPRRDARACLVDVRRTPPAPSYYSPERVLGGSVSIADDTWALAATLYALLTGKAPFEGASADETREKILTGEPARLSSFEIEDDDLQNLLDQAFAKDVHGRLTHLGSLRRALEEWHPDRGVAQLGPIEDEDTGEDDDEGMRTLLVPLRSVNELGQMLAAATAPAAGMAPRPVPAPQVPAAAPYPAPGAPPRLAPRPAPATPAAPAVRRAGGVPGVPRAPGHNLADDSPSEGARTVLGRSGDWDEDEPNLRTQLVMSPPTEGWKGALAGPPPAPPAPFPSHDPAMQRPGAGDLGATMALPLGFVAPSENLPTFPGAGDLAYQPTQALPLGDLPEPHGSGSSSGPWPPRPFPAPSPPGILHPSLSGSRAAIAARGAHRAGPGAIWYVVAIAVAIALAGGAALVVIRLLGVIGRL